MKSESGFTLIEVMISLAIFSLIGLAGFAVVESTVRTQDRTAGRLQQLGKEERLMHLLTLDFGQARADRLSVSSGALTIDMRSGPDIAYSLQGDVLVRQIDRRPQPLMAGVRGLELAVFVPGRGWIELWEPAVTNRTGWPTVLRFTARLGSGDAERTLSRSVPLALPPAP